MHAALILLLCSAALARFETSGEAAVKSTRRNSHKAAKCAPLVAPQIMTRVREQRANQEEKVLQKGTGALMMGDGFMNHQIL